MSALVRLPEWARSLITASRESPEQDIRAVIEGLQDPDFLRWNYLDGQGNEQGPYSTEQMRLWFEQELFPRTLKVKLVDEFCTVDKFYNSKTAAFARPPDQLRRVLDALRDELTRRAQKEIPGGSAETPSSSNSHSTKEC